MWDRRRLSCEGDLIGCGSIDVTRTSCPVNLLRRVSRVAAAGLYARPPRGQVLPHRRAHRGFVIAAEMGRVSRGRCGCPRTDEWPVGAGGGVGVQRLGDLTPNADRGSPLARCRSSGAPSSGGAERSAPNLSQQRRCLDRLHDPLGPATDRGWTRVASGGRYPQAKGKGIIAPVAGDPASGSRASGGKSFRINLWRTHVWRHRV